MCLRVVVQGGVEAVAPEVNSARYWAAPYRGVMKRPAAPPPCERRSRGGGGGELQAGPLPPGAQHAGAKGGSRDSLASDALRKFLEQPPPREVSRLDVQLPAPGIG